jgi:hypothetical protein
MKKVLFKRNGQRSTQREGQSMKKSGLIVSFASALAILVAFAAPTQAANGITVRTEEHEFSFFHPCTNENVDLSGTSLIVAEPVVSDPHGLEFHSVDIAFKGVGESGRRYVSLFTITVSLQGIEGTSNNAAFAETVAVHSRLITPGPGNDLVFSIVFHQTINPNGDLVVFFNRLVAEECV